MSLYLLRSTSDDSVRAITTDPVGGGLPRSLGPWERYPAADELMTQVEAVCEEIRTALELRGYYLIRYGDPRVP